MMRQSKVGGGGFIWALLDESVARTDQNNRLDSAGNQAPDGIVGPHREKEGSFFTIKEIWSPVEIGPKNLPANFSGELTIENRYDFTDLKDCRFEWKLGRFPSPNDTRSSHKIITSGTAKSANIAPHSTGTIKLGLPANWRNADVLYVTAKDPLGRELWIWSWQIRQTSEINRVAAKAVTNKIQTKDAGRLVVVKAGTLDLRFNKDTGLLAEVRRGGKLIEFGNGPRFIAYRRNDRKYDDIAGQSKLTAFRSKMEGSDMIVESSFDGALRRVVWRVSRDGGLRLDYEYSFDGTVDMLGVNFDYPESKMRSIRWLGFGPYRVWQNRIQGTTLDVWENKYNDPTPGESWYYPEFKGYFRGWRWASFQTADGNITVSTDTDDSYLGVYKPKDGKEGLLDFPDTGITFLDVIPAMRNKFHTTDEIGPQSKPIQVSGVKRRTILFNIGGK
jgi:hypothetical protein